MQNNINNKEIFNGFVFNYSTPDGIAYIHILENKPGEIAEIFYTIGKAGTSLNAWGFSLAEMAMFSLKKGASLQDVINKLSNITSERTTITVKGIQCRSGPEALFLALMKYKQSIPKTEPHEYRRAKMNKVYSWR